MARTLGVLLGSCFATTPSAAQDLSLPAPRALLLSADPNSANTSFAWRGSVRGKVSFNVPLVGIPYEDALAAGIQPLFEIHDAPQDNSPLRSPHWRGRLSAFAAWTIHHATLMQLGLEHESDHFTARNDSHDEFLALNDVYWVGSHLWTSSVGNFTSKASAQLYLWTCTELDTPCKDFHGATTLGGGLGGIWELPRGRSEPVPFVSADVAGIWGRREAIGEYRLVLQGGVAWLNEADGLWQVFALLFQGNDLGISRAERLTQWGLGVAYAP